MRSGPPHRPGSTARGRGSPCTSRVGLRGWGRAEPLTLCPLCWLRVAGRPGREGVDAGKPVCAVCNNLVRGWDGPAGAQPKGVAGATREPSVLRKPTVGNNVLPQRVAVGVGHEHLADHCSRFTQHLTPRDRRAGRVTRRKTREWRFMPRCCWPCPRPSQPHGQQSLSHGIKNRRTVVDHLDLNVVNPAVCQRVLALSRAGCHWWCSARPRPDTRCRRRGRRRRLTWSHRRCRRHSRQSRTTQGRLAPRKGSRWRETT